MKQLIPTEYRPNMWEEIALRMIDGLVHTLRNEAVFGGNLEDLRRDLDALAEAVGYTWRVAPVGIRTAMIQASQASQEDVNA